MKEIVKSAVFVAAAVVAGAVAAYYRPAPVATPPEAVGDKLFPEFTDATSVQQLEVISYDQTDDQIDRLEVAREGGQWVLASHKDYPADAENAEERIRGTAINLMDLEILGIASNDVADHDDFGVVAPEKDNIQQGHQSIGLQINVANEAGAKVAQLIIGGKVKGTEDQRFVRRPGQARVYVARINPEDLSPKFEDWINADLLDVNPFDIERILLKDYNVDLTISPNDLTPRAQMTQRFEIAVRYDTDQGKWELEQFRENKSGRGLVDSELLPGEELNTESLNEMKNALADLKIVDIVSKPPGVSADLKAEQDFAQSTETLQSLMGHGFFPVPAAGNQIELYSSDGEVTVTTKDAVQYVLRFGRTAGVEEREGETMLNRYLLVTAQVNQAALPKPELAEVPEAATAPAEQPATEPADAAAGDAQAAQGEQAADAEEQAPPGGQAPAESATATDQERSAIEKENQRKLDEYNEKLQKAQDRVKELNERFADWYYVIPEDVYKKIHLNRFDLIKEAGAEGRSDLEEFRSLEDRGLDAPAADQPPPTGLPGTIQP